MLFLFNMILMLSAVCTLNIFFAYISMMLHLCQPKHHHPSGSFLFKVKNILPLWFPGWRENHWQELQICPNVCGGGHRVVKGQRSEDKDLNVCWIDDSSECGWSRVESRCEISGGGVWGCESPKETSKGWKLEEEERLCVWYRGGYCCWSWGNKITSTFKHFLLACF